jgi:hypothetical protein
MVAFVIFTLSFGLSLTIAYCVSSCSKETQKDRVKCAVSKKKSQYLTQQASQSGGKERIKKAQGMMVRQRIDWLLLWMRCMVTMLFRLECA